MIFQLLYFIYNYSFYIMCGWFVFEATDFACKKFGIKRQSSFVRTIIVVIYLLFPVCSCVNITVFLFREYFSEKEMHLIYLLTIYAKPVVLLTLWHYMKFDVMSVYAAACIVMVFTFIGLSKQTENKTEIKPDDTGTFFLRFFTGLVIQAFCVSVIKPEYIIGLLAEPYKIKTADSLVLSIGRFGCFPYDIGFTGMLLAQGLGLVYAPVLIFFLIFMNFSDIPVRMRNLRLFLYELCSVVAATVFMSFASLFLDKTELRIANENPTFSKLYKIFDLSPDNITKKIFCVLFLILILLFTGKKILRRLKMSRL